MLLKGLVEFLDRSNVRGWAYVVDQADVHLQIEVMVDGDVIGRGSANIVRPDLAQAGIGLGDHAFDIRFDTALPHDAVSRVEVFAAASGGGGLRLNKHSGGYGPAPCPISVFSMPALDTTQFPVFVLGAARSGTSAVAQGLLKCGEYQGFEEGHFLWLLQRFLDAIRAFYAFNGADALPNRFTMLSCAPYTYMASAVRAAFVAAVAEMFPSRKWVDKTPRPQMIEAALLMQELWPNARFIFMKRRGIENVTSRLIKFPQMSFEDHCHDWANSMAAWLTVRDLLGSSALEVEQLAVARAPDRVAREIGQFLQIPIYAVEHLSRSLTSDLPERSSEIHAPTINISRTGWSVAQMTSFRSICGPMMAAFGYSYADEYFGRSVARICVSHA